MEISLTHKLEKIIHNTVSNAHYTSASDVIRGFLLLLNTFDDFNRNSLKEFRQAIDEGFMQLEEDRGVKADTVYYCLQKKIKSKK